MIPAYFRHDFHAVHTGQRIIYKHYVKSGILYYFKTFLAARRRGNKDLGRLKQPLDDSYGHVVARDNKDVGAGGDKQRRVTPF